MVSLCWLLVVMTYACVPGFGSVCWNSSICKDLSNKGRILDCIHLCMSVIQTELTDFKALDLKSNDASDDLLLSIILANLASSEDKISDSDLKAHSDERRSYSMEHFRWGKPSGDKIPEPKLRAHSDERRSYSMEHFRWGKPSGRKRRPIKVFASSLEGGVSSEGSFPPRARRQLSSNEDEAKGDLNQESHRKEGFPKARVSSKSHVLLNPQDRKDGTYRMSHFRWGNPPASKRNGSFMKPWEEKPQGQLAKLFRNIIVKDVQRIMGSMEENGRGVVEQVY
ncbi:pro-opiomelanocortin-like [Toxotes jaculatrix]|uniref:pro-opiomelanocortin-like n=1 Tax=Toxotes jaculatrix TaxID=941984 RepID=UPI001B3AC15A|nr:pro-opiomelanocortin-like [Toxotes jaculatrix]